MSLAEILAEVSQAVGRRASPRFASRTPRSSRSRSARNLPRGSPAASRLSRSTAFACRARRCISPRKRPRRELGYQPRAGAPRRSPTRSAGSGPTAICNDRDARPTWQPEAGGSVETPSGKWRSAREFPGRLVPDPARPAAACACLLPLCPKRRRHCRQPRAERRRQDPAARQHGGRSSTAPRERIRPPRRRCGRALAETGVTAQHCHDVLHAFRLDAVKLRYRRLGRSDGVLPLFGLAGRPPAARPARREPGHLAAFGRAVLGAAGAQPSAGLRRRLPPARPRLPAADGSCRAGNRRRGADGRRVEPGAAPRARRLLDRTAVLVDKARGLPPLVAAPGLRWECGVIVALAGAAAAPGCGAAIRWRPGQAAQDRISPLPS